MVVRPSTTTAQNVHVFGIELVFEFRREDPLNTAWNRSHGWGRTAHRQQLPKSSISVSRAAAATRWQRWDDLDVETERYPDRGPPDALMEACW